MTTASGWSALLWGSNGLRSAALAGGVALHAINVYLVTTILPSVVKDIGGLDYYAWNTTLFVVASIIGSVLSAKCLSALGPRLAYSLAGLVFALGCGVCSSAPDMAVLVFDEGLWPRAIALISGMWGAATLIGPAVGGVFAQYDAWRAAFWALIPVTLLFMLLAWAMLPGKSVEAPPRLILPWLQLVLLTGVVLAIALGSITPSPLYNALGLVCGLVLLYAVYRVEGSDRHRMLPKHSLTPGSALLPIYLSMSLMVIGMTSEVFVPYFLQVLHLQTPLVAGYIAALMAAGWTLGALYSSGLAPASANRAIRCGPLFVVSGLALAALSVPQIGSSLLSLAGVCLAMMAVGTGIGLAWPHLLTRVLANVPDSEKDIAGASITTVQLIATAIGAALAGMIANMAGLTTPGGVTGAASAAAWLFGLYAVLSALLFITVRQVIAHSAKR